MKLATKKKSLTFLFIGLCASVVLLLVFNPFTVKSVSTAPLPKETPIRIFWATDIHYLAPALLHKDSSLMEALESGDGKMTHYSEEIFKAFVTEICRQKPDFVLLSGDLTFNGEKVSHKSITELLKKVKESNIPVLVLPGNHDINQPDAYEFTATGPEYTATVTEKEFWDMYEPFGSVNAIRKDTASMSYLYQVAEDVQLLLLDTSIYQKDEVKEGGLVKEEALVWVEEQLKAAKEAGFTVFTVTHHNLLDHHPLLTEGYTIENNQALLTLLEEYNVNVNFSGHIHAQHIAQSQNGIYDIAGGSMSVNPCYYGEIYINPDRSVNYRAKELNVENWANENHITDENLLHFKEFSHNFMNQCTNIKVYGIMAEYDMSMEERKVMSEFAQRCNTDYFAGVPVGTDKTSSGYKLWETHCKDTPFFAYLNTVVGDTDNSTELFIP